MKTSILPTDHLLIKAYTNSDWDTCEMALIHLSAELKEVLSSIQTHLSVFEQFPTLNSLCFRTTNVDFFAEGEDTTHFTESWAEKGYQFVTLTSEQEIESWQVPENRLHLYRLHAYKDGWVYFSAEGKHTDEEFWTEEIPLHVLLQ